MHILLGGK